MSRALVLAVSPEVHGHVDAREGAWQGLRLDGGTPLEAGIGDTARERFGQVET